MVKSFGSAIRQHQTFYDFLSLYKPQFPHLQNQDDYVSTLGITVRNKGDIEGIGLEQSLINIQ